MSDTSNSEEETEQEKPVAGRRLAEARQAQGISVLDIAKELHLDEPKVRALEENNFDVLGAPVFAKGHLRKYADLVGVSTDDILADYYLLNRAVGAPPLVGIARQQPRDLNLGRWVAGFFIVVLIVATVAGVYWWLEIRVSNPAAQTGAASLAPFVSSEETDARAGEPESVANPEQVATESDADMPQAEVVPSDIIGNTDEPLAMDELLPADDVPQATLSMSFNGDCWTEVSDASGKRLYFALGVAGSNATVTGAAPLRVLFGDSGNVTLVVNGQDYAIRDSQRNGRTARLTINAQ